MAHHVFLFVQHLHCTVYCFESAFRKGEDPMSERIPCQSAGCSATILPTTALKTGGICMPCLQKKLAAEREAYILQNREDVNRYEGVTDPVEILKIMHLPRRHNPLERELPYPKSIREVYHQLSEAERERLETYAISLMDEEDFDQAETILLSLMCFTDARIGRGVRAFFLKERIYPGILYKGAEPAIRDELIRLVDMDEANRNHLLLALAWIGDEEVVRLFAKWRRSPPAWATSCLFRRRIMPMRLAGSWIRTAGNGSFFTVSAITLKKRNRYRQQQ
jgi:hypothetical protein